MSEQRKTRKEVQCENNTPENFTCGNCKRVVPYSEGYNCPYCNPVEE